jgi:hypothetical protein
MGCYNWDHNILGDLEKRIKQAKSELEAVRRGSISQENVSRELLLREKLDRMEQQRDTFLETEGTCQVVAIRA